MLTIPFALVVAATNPAPNSLPSGTYGLVMHFTSEPDAPIVGKVTTETTSTALVELSTRDDGKIIAQQSPCALVTDAGLFTTRASPAFLKAMGAASYELVIDGDKLVGDMGVEAVGVDKRTKTLPDDNASAAYTDPDGDGKKGVPLEVDVGGMKLNLDVAHLGRAVLKGTVEGDHARGETEIVSSQLRILSGLPAFVGQGKTRVAKSSFSLEPIAPNGTCHDVERLGDVAARQPRGTPSASSKRSTSRT